MTPLKGSSTWITDTMPRRRLTTVDFTAALVGASAAIGVLVSVGTSLTSVAAGISLFETSNLERLAASTLATVVGLVFAAFFCGGWVYGALRGREDRGGFGDVLSEEHEVRDPEPWDRTGTRRGAIVNDRDSMGWASRRHLPRRMTNELWAIPTHSELDVAEGQLDEFVGPDQVRDVSA